MTGAYFMREGSAVAGKEEEGEEGEEDSYGGPARCKSAPGPSDDIRWRKDRRGRGPGSDPVPALLYTSGAESGHRIPS